MCGRCDNINCILLKEQHTFVCIHILNALLSLHQQAFRVQFINIYKTIPVSGSIFPSFTLGRFHL